MEALNRRTRVSASAGRPSNRWSHSAPLFLLTLLLVHPASAAGQSAGEIDLTFNAGVIDGAVLGLARQADSKIVVIGDFNQIGGARRAHVARLNPDGSVDESFIPAPELWLNSSNVVTHLGVQSDGAAILGGRFDVVDPASGTSSTFLAIRLTVAGNLDWAFGPVTMQPISPLRPPWSSPLAMVLQSDKVILAYNGFAPPPDSNLTNVMRRLTAEGKPDLEYATPPGFANSPVQLWMEQSGSVLSLWSAAPSFPRGYGLIRFSATGIELSRCPIPGLDNGFGSITSAVDAIAPEENGEHLGGRRFRSGGAERLSAISLGEPHCPGRNLGSYLHEQLRARLWLTRPARQANADLPKWRTQPFGFSRANRPIVALDSAAPDERRSDGARGRKSPAGRQLRVGRASEPGPVRLRGPYSASTGDPAGADRPEPGQHESTRRVVCSSRRLPVSHLPVVPKWRSTRQPNQRHDCRSSAGRLLSRCSQQLPGKRRFKRDPRRHPANPEHSGGTEHARLAMDYLRRMGWSVHERLAGRDRHCQP